MLQALTNILSQVCACSNSAYQFNACNKCPLTKTWHAPFQVTQVNPILSVALKGLTPQSSKFL